MVIISSDIIPLQAYITEIRGDLFESPEHSVLIHACNCVGAWGAGIALEFKKRYPNAYTKYHQWCNERIPADLLGCCILIEPRPNDYRQHWIACLFTSHDYGRRKDKLDVILHHTVQAMRELTLDVRDVRSMGKAIGGLFACRLNSGNFGIPWKDTGRMLRQVQGLVLTVVEVEKKMVQLKRMTKGDLIMDADKRGLPSTWKMLLCKRLLEATGPDALRLHDQDDWPGSLTLEQLQSELLHHNIGLPERDCSLKRGELTKAELQAILMEYDARNAASTAEEVPTTEQATKRLRSE